MKKFIKITPLIIVSLIISLVFPFLVYYKIIILIPIIIYLFKIYKDLDLLKKKEQKFEELYNTTIKESNHRIKNNINILTNIIELKKFVYTDLEIIELLDDLRNKTVLISKIHEKIYESCNVKNINIKLYIEDVINTINGFYDNEINIIFDVDNCMIKSKFAVDIALIIQEFFTNAIKYAYSEQDNKTFFIFFKKLNDFEYLIKMSDNGIGFENTDLNQTSNFGLKIIQNIIAQYKGKIKLFNNNGANIEINLIAKI